MPIALVPYFGSGTIQDPRRPDGVVGNWQSVPLDGTGHALVVADTLLPSAIALGDTFSAALSAKQRSSVGAALGFTITAATVRDLFPELLLTHLRLPIELVRRGDRRIRQIWLGELVWEQVIEGGPGAMLSDSFDRVDATNLGANWTDVSANAGWQIKSNAAESTANGSQAVANADLASGNHRASVSITSIAATGAPGTLVRASTTDTTGYFGRLVVDGTWQLFKLIDGAATQIGSLAGALPTLPVVLETKVDGSAVSLLQGTTVRVGPITDTSVASTRRKVGILTYSLLDRVDDFAAQDLAPSTRFYLPSSGAAAVSPAFGAWNLTTGADRIALTRTSGTGQTAFATRAVAETLAAVSDVLVRQYVSDPLPAAGTLSGSVKGIVRAMESATAADMRAQLLIRVVSNDGATVRGTALAINTGALASEFGTALANRRFPLGWSGVGAALTDVAYQTDDRIVVEIGYRAHNTVTTSRTGTLEFGNVGTSDLAEDETSTAQLNPWIEFSQDLFPTGPAPTAVGMEVQARWDVQAPATTALIGRWDVSAAVAKVLAGRWDVATSATRSTEGRWDVGALAGRPVGAAWDQQASAAKHLDARWDVAASVGRALAGRWDVTTSAGRAVAGQWDVLSAAGLSRVARWDLASPSGRSLGAIYDVLARSSRVIDARWDVLASAGANRSALWDVWGLASAERTLLWDVAGVLSAVGVDRQVLWDLRLLAGGTVDGRWDIAGFVGTGRDARWDVAQATGSGLAAAWDVRSRANRSVAAAWDVLGAIGQERQARWDVLRAEGRSTVVLWDVAGALASVGVAVAALWDAQAPSGQSLAGRWDVLAKADRAVGAVWDVTVPAGTERQARWDLAAVAGGGLAVVWDSRASAGAGTAARWDVLVSAGLSTDVRWDVLLTASAAMGARWTAHALASSTLLVLWDVASQGFPIPVWAVVTLARPGARISVSRNTPARSSGPSGSVSVSSGGATVST